MKPFRATLLEALSIDPRHAKLAWLGNFEVERDWQSEHVIGLPRFAPSSFMHQYMSELALLLSDPEDMVLLKEQPDEDFLRYLSSLGWQKPLLLTPERKKTFGASVAPANGEPSGASQSLANGGPSGASPALAPMASSAASLTRGFLATEAADLPPAAVRWLRTGGGVLMPHGTSAWEERLSAQWRIPLAAPPAAVARGVNSKLYSRSLCRKHRIRQAEGHTVETLDQLEQAYRDLFPLSKHGPLVLKEGMGVSGKGLLIIGNEARFRQIVRMLRQAAEKRGTERTEFVLEQWIAKSKDLNVQFIVSKAGRVERMEVLTALVDHGSHLGHVHPHGLVPALEEQLEYTAAIVGSELHAQGYFGAVGIDAIIGADGTLYPCLEINARLNMSTYHTRVLHEWIPADRHVLIRPFSFARKGPVGFEQVRRALRERLYSRFGQSGILICSFASVNMADHRQLEIDRGTVFTMLIGRSPEECKQLQHFCRQQLQRIGGGGDDGAGTASRVDG